MVELSQTPDPYEKCLLYFIQSQVCGLLCSYLDVYCMSVLCIGMFILFHSFMWVLRWLDTRDFANDNRDLMQLVPCPNLHENTED